MCGIFGFYGENLLGYSNKFINNLKHRGPDGFAIYSNSDGNLTLGHTRLSIIDLSEDTNQPMVSECQKYAITFNGEIYNYLELKKELIDLNYIFRTKSDTEVVLNAYIEWGAAALSRFRGMFAFCIYSVDKKTLFLARDRLGIKPLIYYFDGSKFIFSSEIQPIINSRIVDIKISSDSLSEYLSYGSIKQPNTIVENFFQLMPGHTLTFHFDGQLQFEEYYNIVSEVGKIEKFANYSDAVQCLRSELEVATRYHMVSDVEIGAFLSGGVDSATVVSLMSKLQSNKINTFTVGFTNNYKFSDETSLSTEVAQKYNCNHNSIIVDDNYILNIINDYFKHMDQPTNDGLNTFIVSREASKKVKVAISGLGGDEVFSGYPHYSNLVKYSNNSKYFHHYFFEYLNNIRPNRLTNKYKFYSLDFEDCADLYRRNNLRNLPTYLFAKNKPVNKLDTLSPLQKISKFELNNYLLNTLLRDSDVFGMACSLEIRPTLLDHKIIELGLSFQDDFKIRNGINKSILIDSVKDIIPLESWNRKKSGFEMPYKTWLNGCLNTIFLDYIYNSNLVNALGDSIRNDLLKRTKEKKLTKDDWTLFTLFGWELNSGVKI